MQETLSLEVHWAFYNLHNAGHLSDPYRRHTSTCWTSYANVFLTLLFRVFCRSTVWRFLCLEKVRSSSSSNQTNGATAITSGWVSTTRPLKNSPHVWYSEKKKPDDRISYSGVLVPPWKKRQTYENKFCLLFMVVPMLHDAINMDFQFHQSPWFLCSF